MKSLPVKRDRWLLAGFLFVLILSGCSDAPIDCPSPIPVDLSQMSAYFDDERYPYQFPLKNAQIFESRKPLMTVYAKYGTTHRGPEHHAAEDILQPAGTPVYAIADGKVSFSGPMGGYGWLVIIDHPEANIYSLYGHLSPSRWQIAKGSVGKGDLVGYLGDADENGGSAQNPMQPHLHFGIRVGQRADYPGMGQWRWQAGWIKPCPQELGWLQPSVVIASQDIHFGDSHQPEAGFLARWWNDMLFFAIYLFGGICMLIVAENKKNPYLLIIAGVVLSAAAWLYSSKSLVVVYSLIILAFLLLSYGTYRLLQQRRRNPDPNRI